MLTHVNAVIGTPEQVMAQLLAWQQEANVEEIMCQVYAAGIRHEDSLRTIRLMGKKILPQLQIASRESIKDAKEQYI
ncbi:MAG TPA: hypothetical protein VL461_10145 [Dictyobacter sp.]|nr:hypothetical protein [Dictyobacter sp.]